VGGRVASCLRCEEILYARVGVGGRSCSGDLATGARRRRWINARGRRAPLALLETDWVSKSTWLIQLSREQ